MKRKSTVRRILGEAYCRLAPSPIHGVGVFAVRDIPKGVNPFGIGIRYPCSGIEITPAELKRAPPGVRHLLASLFLPDDDGVFRVPVLGANLVDIGAYLNHSDRPNMRTADGHRFVTKRRIRAGDELTVDYRTFGGAGLLKRGGAR
jgi:SET domain-containing protein